MEKIIKISISSVHGTKQFSFGKFSQRSLRVIGAGLLFTLIVVLVTLFYLRHAVEESKIKEGQLASNSISLEEEVLVLQNLKFNLENDLLQREERILLVSNKLENLEGVIGFEKADDKDLIPFDSTSIGPLLQDLMLNLMPSGSPIINGEDMLEKQSGKNGVYFSVDNGTPVYAPADGVIEVVQRRGSGSYMRIQHSYGFSSSYSYLDKLKVGTGEFIQKGDLIADSGSSSEPGLYYEIDFLKRAIDPQPFISWGVNNFDTIFNENRGIKWESLMTMMNQKMNHQQQLSSLEEEALLGNLNWSVTSKLTGLLMEKYMYQNL